MGTGTIVHAFAMLAIHAEHLVSWGKIMGKQVIVRNSSGSGSFACNLPAFFCTIVLDMIKS